MSQTGRSFEPKWSVQYDSGRSFESEWTVIGRSGLKISKSENRLYQSMKVDGLKLKVDSLKILM